MMIQFDHTHANIFIEPISDSYFDPGFTSYNATVLYAVHDVTDLLLDVNVDYTIGVQLGNGWWNLIPLLFWGR